MTRDWIAGLFWRDRAAERRTEDNTRYVEDELQRHYESETGLRWLTPGVELFNRITIPLPYPMSHTRADWWLIGLALLWLAAALGWLPSIGIWAIGVASAAVVAAHLLRRSITPSDIAQRKRRLIQQNKFATYGRF